MGAPDAFMEKMRDLGCECACFPGGRVKLVMPDSIEARDLYATAGQCGVQVRRIHQRRDSLEDIFLRAMDNAENTESSNAESRRGELVRL